MFEKTVSMFVSGTNVHKSWQLMMSKVEMRSAGGGSLTFQVWRLMCGRKASGGSLERLMSRA